MILIDPRAGSGSGTHHGTSSDLVPYLTALTVPAQHQPLEFADAAFTGFGPGHALISIGIELKIVSDALECMQTGRLAGHQLVGLQKTYQQYWIIVEGPYRRNPDTAVLETPNGHHTWHPAFGKRGNSREYYTWNEFFKWQVSLITQGGAHIIRTYDRLETAAAIAAIHNWWQEPWEHHSTLKVFNTAMDCPLVTQLDKITDARKLFSKLPGVGWDRAECLEQYFGSISNICAATPDIIAEVKCNGRRIGESLGWKIFTALHDESGKTTLSREKPKQ